MNNEKFVPTVLIIIFITLAVSLWVLTGKIFYLLNFLYIGLVVSLGVLLMVKEYTYARIFVQLGVGLYMFIYLGIILGENMQIEGFFYYLFLGVFQAAWIHYFVAKIAGPLIFGRGWCGYACWTAMVLDLLPYKKPKHPRMERLGVIRYAMFIVALAFVSALFLLNVSNLEWIMALLFIIGNAIYYLLGIYLAVIFKDNRAFCKYICPVTTFLKPMSYFSLIRIKVDINKCINCNTCVKACPMDVDMLNPNRSRTNGTECILCLECAKTCPQQAIGA